MGREAVAARDALRRLGRHDEHGGGDARLDGVLRAVGEQNRHGDVVHGLLDGEQRERSQAEFGGAAEDGRVFVADAFDAICAAGCGGVERIARRGGDATGLRGDGIAVRVRRRVAEQVGDAIFEFFADGVFEPISFGVHLIPGETHGFHQIQLDQAMMADDLESDAFAGGGEGRALIRNVFDEVQFGKLFEHAGDRGGFDVQTCSERGGGRSTMLIAQFEDGFEIVLDRFRKRARVNACSIRRTMAVIISIACGIAGYLLGSVPFGYLIVKMVKGVDIRTLGSGRTGGTNVYRAAGFWAGLVTALLDIGKGALAVTLVRAWFPQTLGWAEALTGIGVILGHNYSCFLGFRGGAGGATAVGTGMALWWAAGTPALLLGCVMLFGVGYASVATLVAGLSVAVVFTLAAIFGWENFGWSYAVYGWAVFVLCAIALRPNIERLRNGTEKKVNILKRPQGQGGA